MGLLVMAAGTAWGLGYGIGVLLLVAWAVRMLHWAWWKPRQLERALREQGLDGTHYRFLRGDLGENEQLLKKAQAKPMPLYHDITPRVAPSIHHAMEKYGKVPFEWFGPVPRVIITDPDLVREVLSNKFGHYGKPKISHPLARYSSGGLAAYDGEKWVKHRRILNPAFHIEKLKLMLPAVSACCDELVDRWEKLVTSETCYELDVYRELQNLTGDAISRTAFGSNYEEGRRIFQLQDEQLLLLLQSLKYAFIPGYRFLPTRTISRMKATDTEIRTLLRGIIKKKEEALRVTKTSTDDLLGMLIESNIQHVQENGTREAGMTTEEVIDECKIFYFAGHETTSLLLTWTMVALSMHPSWQERARQEVLQVFGQDKPDFDGLSRLKTVTMILYEVLRLYPPVISLSRQAHKTMKLGEVVYPRGVQLLLSIISIHHDVELWGEDAKEFNPERFAEGISKASKEKNALFPFGAGPRICIGQNFAILEAKMGLSMILQRFTFELSPSYVHAPRPLTLKPQYGVQLRLRRLRIISSSCSLCECISVI